MDIAEQRGNKSLLESLRAGAKKVSEANGYSESMKLSARPQAPVIEGGAFNSVNKEKTSVSREVLPASYGVTKPITENYSQAAFTQKLLESVATLSSTGEYFNAVSSLFTLYAMDQLTEGVMDSLTRQDIKEIKSILRDFQKKFDSY